MYSRRGIFEITAAYIMIGGNAMKTMKIEKQLLFADNVKQVVKLQVSDGLKYQHENDGIRALGPLYISGQYVNGESAIQNFQETLDMDVLAPNNKLSSDRFYLEVAKSEGNAVDGGIGLEIMLRIHGLKEDALQREEKQEVRAEYQIPQQEIESSYASSIEQIPAPLNQQIDEEPPKEVQSVETIRSEEETKGEFEDLFEDAGTTYTSYRMIVARNNDSYATIAQRYEVGEEELRNANRNKDILEKTLVILPNITA